MQQLSLFESHQYSSNTAVPLRSPFRYPGGKTWLVPRIRSWLASQEVPPMEFIEPFAGGGIVSLTVAFEQLAHHVTIAELDADVAAVWLTMLSPEAEWLANQIAAFDFSPDTVNYILSQRNISTKEKAFQTILKNRINRGGILAPGAGKIKLGEHGMGLKSRWYPETLKKRILDIMSIRQKISFIPGDGMEVLLHNVSRTDAVFFIDPPYSDAGKKAGKRLYKHWEINHEQIFDIASRLKGNFLMTYDNTEEVRQRAHRYGFAVEAVAMKNAHHAPMTELLIKNNA
ncbi:DNA adenine methylase [[Phormidium] sp. ETS-05]|uniref:DNA adenine methylase n=1 Tax=[Phormidium] sp. ETS-05 TaxID=222819 RepID=UPI0018EF1613|nr:DNA adenine methylase [[Phormidium] sp. ETS-05]